MTKLEHFKQWADTNYPETDQEGKASPSGKVVFDEPDLQMAWRAFQHAFTIRPTSNSKLDKVAFKADDPETVVDRLRGVYPNATPPYATSPLQQEAAREIERLKQELRQHKA